MRKFKMLLTELLWIVISAALVLSVLGLVLGKRLFKKTIDINLYDTYFITTIWALLIPLFILCCFVIYYFKERKYGYQRKGQVLFIIFTGLGILIFLSRISGLLSNFSTRGWTVYPSLNPIKEINNNSFDLSDVILIFQTMMVLLLINIGYKWGKGVSKNA
ncbi:hypothetical protein [Pedobacter nototheniae]|uniref:hypothetical protein n=1 Tax=Pedobacter nototheniae TaxID=2488994 RepID=UPI00292CE022|nr:hypothetical protein [Pedobacter nototheniae]